MKKIQLNIFRKFALVIFLLTAVLGFLFMVITYLATTYYHEASTQLLNKDVAWHIAKFTSPFNSKGIDKEKADSVFQSAMVLSPSAEVYFLDSSGKVIYFHADEKEILQWQVSLKPVEEYIVSKGEKYIKGTDPRDPSTKKIFSATSVEGRKGKLGYIYVILDSRKSENIMGLIFGSHVINLAWQAFLIIIALSLTFTLLYLKRISRNFQHVINVLKKFEAGDYTARFDEQRRNELQPVTQSFNKMADLLTSSISIVTASESERKNFIATISHDLRTPLSNARGYLETMMLKKSGNGHTAEQREQYLQLVYHKILQIENMVKQLFELSKMESAEFRPEKEPFVFSEIVQELVNTFELAAKEKKIDLNCAECLHHLWIKADVGLMERAVQNLVENALKNTDPGCAIRVSVTKIANEVVFTIINEGTIVPEQIVQWVNHFKDNPQPIGNRPAKAGFGLLIVQKILQLHDAVLKVQSTGKITTFSFALPLYSAG